MNEKILLSGDVDAIKEYVFETSYLPQIRGGSQLLIDCEEAIKKFIDDSGGDKIYCGGGSFLFLVPREKAGDLKNEIEQIYLDKTGTATITVTIEKESAPLEDPGLLDGWASRLWQASGAKDRGDRFALRASLIAADLREEKVQKRTAPFQEKLPFIKVCDCCGKRMASEKIQRSPRGEVVEALRACKICQIKHLEGGKRDYGTRGKFNEDFYEFMMERDQRFAASPALPAKDLEELTKGMRKEHIAFLYADGNDIGNLLLKAGDEDGYRTLSKGLTNGTKKALFEALFKVCGPALRGDGKGGIIWPFEIVTVGGDDIIVLVQACYAWELAVEFLENFEKYVKDLINQDVTASCGIAIADVKYPVRYLRSLAEGSLKRAKKKAKDDPQNPMSAIDFIWLPNPVLSERVETLAGYYHRGDRSLTARPYALDEAKTLKSLMENATDLPRSQRHLWGEALERGIQVSRNAIFYNVARMKEDKLNEFKKFLKDVTDLVTPQNWEAPQSIWVERKEGEKNRWCTALLDVLELAELHSMRKDRERKEEKA
ncbi:MAG TPA: hypothetical protein PLQ38_07280 [Methanothrix sp.]|nr:hypothetical protein [Methanothrix sp.]